MKVLFNDIVQYSDAPASLKTPALADRMAYSGPVKVTFDFPRYIDSVGISTDAKVVKLTWAAFDGFILNNMNAATSKSSFEKTIFGGAVRDRPDDFSFAFCADFPAGTNTQENVFIYYDESGLYEVPPIITDSVTIECDGTYIGRFGAGRGIALGTALAKEPSFNTTNENKKTQAGQIIPGAGGYNFRSVGLDTRYKIGGAAMSEIKAAYPGQIARGYPFFLLFDSEIRRLPFSRMYARDASTDKFGFESGVHDRYLFSRKFDFEECF
jgi:hypothetical protein